MVTEQQAWEQWRGFLASGDVAGDRALLAGVLNRDAAASLARSEDALDMARTLRDGEAESYALVGLSRVALRAGDHAQVVRLAQQAQALVDDPVAAAAPLHLHAAGTRLLGDYDEAKALYEESLELARTSGDSRMETMELHNLGHVELHRGDVAAAERLFAEWRTRVESSADPYDAAMRLLNDAALASAHGDRERARALLDEAERSRAAAGIVLDPDDASEVEYLRASMR